jgi:hypothetical protein
MRKLALAMALLGSGMSTSGFVLAENEERWYQVEVLVFEQRRPDADAEIWPTMPKAEVAELITLDPSYSEWSCEAESPICVSTAEVIESLPLDSDSSEENEQEAPALVWPMLDQDEESNTVELGFVALPSNLLQLNNEKAQLESQSYDILWHQGWNQAVPALTEPSFIEIRAGEQLGAYSELQGHMRLAVSRYLHIAFELYQNKIEAASDPFQFAFDLPKADDNKAFEGLELRSEINDSVVESNSAWIVKQSVMLSQERRLTSRKIHYVDHPTLGILFLFTPYTPQHLQEES